MSKRDVKIAVYGDLNLNILDGSAIWLQSLCSVLSLTKRASVTILLKAGEERNLLTAPIRALPNVKVVCPVDDDSGYQSQLSTEEALLCLERLDSEQPFDLFVFRGYGFCYAAATRENGAFAGRMLPYLTAIPQYNEELNEEHVKRIRVIAEASKFVLCQTEALRCYLESFIAGVAGKAVLLPPMIPDSNQDEPSASSSLSESQPLRLVYIGKFAPLWFTYEMIQAIDELRGEGVLVELHMIGDKIHNVPGDPGFHDRMKSALEDTDGVYWHGAMTREKSIASLSEYHLAVGWRDNGLDDSLELSTKLLEYGQMSLPVIVNRNPMHEELLGEDYPLFANSLKRFKEAVKSARDQAVRQHAAKSGWLASKPFQYSGASQLLNRYIDRAVPQNDIRAGQKRPLRLVVACHDFKFFTRIQEHLGAIRGVELRVDSWPTIAEHDVEKSKELVEWADVVICEWFCNNAIWYSNNKKPGQKLIVRLHRFELYGQYPHKANIDNIDRVVLVGDYYRDEAISRLGWDASKLSVIPNWVDDLLMNRTKVPGAFFNLGMIGIAPMRKRLDRGLDIVEKLRKEDSRFQLYIKSKLPWEYPWIWSKPEEQSHYRDIFQRCNESEFLLNAVHYDPFGPEVGAWLRKIGFILSTSDDESFHLAPAEGMASGALPMLLNWQGVEAIYPDKWIHSSTDEIVDTILKIRDSGSWAQDGLEVKPYISENYSVKRVCADWEALVLGHGN